ncbi:MAG: ABC transporter permease [Chitinivibrionales bacterium]
MLRYLRLYGYFLRFSFSRAMEFRVDFFFRIFMDLLFYAINIGFYKVIFLHTSVLGGWSEEQIMVFIAGFLLLDALGMTILSNNLWFLPLYVNNGDLDYYLVRPVSSLFFLSFRDFAANSFVNLLVSFVILYWALYQYGGPVTFSEVLFFIFLIGVGFILRYFVRMMMVIPVFWLHQGRGLELVFWHLTRFIERPDRIYTGLTRVILTTVLPFALMASYPARLFLEPFRWTTFLHLLSVTTVFGALVLVFWRAGLRAYSSASS